MTELQDKCPQCHTVIPEGTDVCPGCQAQLVFCFNVSCCKPYPGQMENCPACGAANEMVEVFREALAEQEGGGESGGAPADDAPDSPSTSPAVDPSASAPGALVLPPGDRLAGTPSPNAPYAPAAPAVPGMSPEDIAKMLAELMQTDAGSASPSPASLGLVPQRTSGAVAPASSAGYGLLAGLAPGMIGLPGNITSMLAATGVSMGTLTLEVDTSQSPKRGQQGLLRFRVTSAEDGQIDLVATSGFWPAPEYLEARVSAGESYEFPALKFVPRVAGTEEIQVAIDLRSASDVPIGRWQTTHDLAIEDSLQSAGGSIQAEVVIMGGPGGMNVSGLGAGMPGIPPMPALPGLGGGWQTLALRPDPEFQRRMARACPEPEAAPPALPGPPLAGRVLVHAVVQISEEASGRLWAVAAVGGDSASLGRGGEPSVAWWLEPFPYDPQQHRRLSRQHTLFSLRDGRAWVTDRSTNGTLMNGRRLRKDRPKMLAQDDQVDPAGVCGLRVRLEANEGRVHALWLDRGDGLSEQMRYLLTDGRAPVRLAVPGMTAPLWLAWTAQPGEATKLALQSGGTWATLETSQEASLPGGWRLRWQTLAQPQPQQEYLRRLS